MTSLGPPLGVKMHLRIARIRKDRMPVSTARLGALTAFCAAVMLAAATVAWACVPQPRLITLQPRSSGPAGSAVTVAALGFDPGRAEVRWNAGDGELLGTANGPDFSVGVTIPQVAEGLYHVVVLARSPGGEIGNTSTVSFEVTGEAGAAAGASSPPASQPRGEPVSTSSSPTSAMAALLFAAGGGLVALGFLGGILLSRQGRKELSAKGDHRGVK